MRCPNCSKDVDLRIAYCTHCGTHLGSRLCPNGHVMDASWLECQTCAHGFRKGGTVLETPGASPGSQPGSFVRGATLLEGESGGAKRRTQLDGCAPKGNTVVDPRLGGAVAKGNTIFQSGSPGSGSETPPSASPITRPRLVGWLITFTHDPSGEDYQVREGRNVIGSSQGECDVLIDNDPTVSSRHAVLMYRNGRFGIRDNDSQNGTYINGTDIFGKESVTLSEGDLVRVGATELVFKVL